MRFGTNYPIANNIWVKCNNMWMKCNIRCQLYEVFRSWLSFPSPWIIYRKPFPLICGVFNGPCMWLWGLFSSFSGLSSILNKSQVEISLIVYLSELIIFLEIYKSNLLVLVLNLGLSVSYGRHMLRCASHDTRPGTQAAQEL